MESVQNGAVDEDQPVEKPEDVVQEEAAPLEGINLDSWSDAPAFKYSHQANDPHNRKKRALPNPNKRKKSCSLYIQTDPLFWRHIRGQVSERVMILRALRVLHANTVNHARLLKRRKWCALSKPSYSRKRVTIRQGTRSSR